MKGQIDIEKSLKRNNHTLRILLILPFATGFGSDSQQTNAANATNKKQKITFILLYAL